MELAIHEWHCLSGPEGEKGKFLFLHGLGGTGALWRPIAIGLEAEFSILALDQRGHGGSRVVAPDPTTGLISMAPENYAADVAETLGTRNFRPVIAVGHSMGARTAATLAARNPDLVRACVLVDMGLGATAGGH
ncbi:MAG: alpha/beta fold hydrolase, partial [Bdellovibrionota bacterium]